MLHKPDPLHPGLDSGIELCREHPGSYLVASSEPSEEVPYPILFMLDQCDKPRFIWIPGYSDQYSEEFRSPGWYPVLLCVDADTGEFFLDFTECTIPDTSIRLLELQNNKDYAIRLYPTSYDEDQPYVDDADD